MQCTCEENNGKVIAVCAAHSEFVTEAIKIAIGQRDEALKRVRDVLATPGPTEGRVLRAMDQIHLELGR